MKLSFSIFEALFGSDQELRRENKKDKEYFLQEWFLATTLAAGLPVAGTGRNKNPDYWAEEEGYEVKGLSSRAGGHPCRKDLDFNSSTPCGRVGGKDRFLVFGVYDLGAPTLRISTLVVAHLDLINDDEELVRRHANVSEPGFGSFEDGFVRIRKMYRFPHPVAILPEKEIVGSYTMIVPRAYPVPGGWGWEEFERGGKPFLWHSRRLR